MTSSPKPSRPTGVAVVEDHEILRSGLVACLEQDDGLRVTATEPRAPALEEVQVAVVSEEAARSHVFPCPLVVCSDRPDVPPEVAPGNEVAGVLDRGSLTTVQLHATVRAAAAGLKVNADAEGARGHEEFEPRALRLLELIAEGHSTREIAHRMSYSERTIKKLITGLEERMEARSRAQVVAQAIRRGLI